MGERYVTSYKMDPLKHGKDHKVEMARDAEILGIGPGDGFLYLYCLVQDDVGMEIRIFRSLMAGQMVEDDMHYIDTVQMGMSRWAFYIFEVGGRS